MPTRAFEIPKTMRAIVYRGANDLRLETLPVPRIGRNEILVKVAVCGVCPTDIKKIHHATVPPPRIFGHETSGQIVKLGASVRGWALGDRVALHHHVPCRRCHACRHHAFAQCPQYKRTGVSAGFEPAGGGYAEYVRVMSFVLPGVVRIPARNSYLEGALLEPVNTVLKGVLRLKLQRGDRVMVVGQGPIGLMFTRLLQLHGAKVLATDLIERRLEVARQFGAELTVRGNDEGLSERVKSWTRDQGLDAVVLAVPANVATAQGLNMLRGGGKLLLFAHTQRGEATAIDLSTLCVEEKDLIGSYSSDIELQGEVSKLVFTRKLDVRRLVTNEFPLAQTKKAVDLASVPTEESLKIVITQNQNKQPCEAKALIINEIH